MSREGDSESTIFYLGQKGRRGSMTCVDEVLIAKEEWSRLRREAEAHMQQLFVILVTSTCIF